MDNVFGDLYDQPKARLLILVRKMPELLELEEFLYDVFNLHNRLALIGLSKWMPRDPIKTRKAYSLNYPRKYLSKDGLLQLVRIEIGSPGIIDFKGIGDAIRAIKEIIELFLCVRQDRQSRELDLAIKETEVYRVFRKQGLAPKEISALLKRRRLKRAAEWIDKVRVEDDTGNKDGE